MGKTLTAEIAREVFTYDAKTGSLFWKERGLHWFKDQKHSAVSVRDRWNARYAGELVGHVSADGYLKFSLQKTLYLVHRVVWLYHFGVWPVFIDHINGTRDDNRIENLRNVENASENQRNLSGRYDSKTGHSGVSWCKRSNKWRAYININRGQIYLGVFEEFDDALAARKAKAKELGFSDRHGERGKVYLRTVLKDNARRLPWLEANGGRP